MEVGNGNREWGLKEVTGNKIFAEDGEDGELEDEEDGELESGSMKFTSNNKTSVQIVQVILCC